MTFCFKKPLRKLGLASLMFGGFFSGLTSFVETRAEEFVTSEEAAINFSKLREKISEIAPESTDSRRSVQSRLSEVVTELEKALREFLNERVEEIVSSYEIFEGENFSTKKTGILLLEKMDILSFDELNVRFLDERHEMISDLIDHFDKIEAADYSLFFNEVIDQMAKDIIIEIKVDNDIHALIENQIQKQMPQFDEDGEESINVMIDEAMIRSLGPEFNKAFEEAWVGANVIQLLFIQMAKEMWPGLPAEILAAREIAVAARSKEIWNRLDFFQTLYDYQRLEMPYQRKEIEEAFDSFR